MKKIYLILILLLATSCIGEAVGVVFSSVTECALENSEKRKEINKVKEEYEKEKSSENCIKYRKLLENYFEFSKECTNTEDLKKYKETYKTLNCE